MRDAVPPLQAGQGGRLLAAVSSGPKPVQDDAKPPSPPVVTVTVTATPPPSPAVSAPTLAPSPSPSPSAAAPSAGAPSAPAPAERPPVRKAPSGDDGKAASPPDAPVSGSTSDGGTSGSSGSGGGGGGGVSYRNCTAVREAGAAPIRRGDAGYGSHLDRDGDGVACE
ncbi:excalibur calcium-binding domain-containing protein [Streptomyces sp. NPDC058289]|uniref:excalibur calcium-binding domain-containing protein n=1 Tax=Streptomyces sp. NPDC058289 TaxID=3346425 RepID=UPI0036E69CCD